MSRVGYLRAKFLLEAIDDLECNLNALGHKLITFVGPTYKAFIELNNTYNIQSIHSYGPELCSEEQLVEKKVKDSMSAPLIQTWGWTLHHIDDLPKWMQRGKKIPGRYKPFLQAVQRGKRSFKARQAVATPTQDAMSSSINLVPSLNNFLKSIVEKNIIGWGKPKLGDLINISGKKWNKCLVKGGETAAFEALNCYVWKDDKLSHYVGSSDSMSPGKNNALNSTTGLSPYLATGCLSPRYLYDTVREYERKRRRNRSTYWVFHELVFRDYFAFSCIKWKNKIFSLAGPLDCSGHKWIANREEAWKRFRRWCNGTTGFPFIDAGMRQLQTEGKMPHLLRQACAGFLVRDLRVDWRWGAEWFESQLLDYTPDANWGNWGYRILPIKQLQPLSSLHLTSLEILSWPVVHDPHLTYILKWIPELKEIAKLGDPVKVREPWRLAYEYKRVDRIDVSPCRDSPLWIMSVNRNNWPDYQKMMSGYAYTVSYDEKKTNNSYPLPIVPPIELEIFYDKIPVDHSWGNGSRKQRKKKKHSGRKQSTKHHSKGTKIKQST